MLHMTTIANTHANLKETVIKIAAMTTAVLWAAPKFSLQASLFVPVPQQKNHTQNFGSALRSPSVMRPN